MSCDLASLIPGGKLGQLSNALPASSILWLLTSSPGLSEGVITNISVIQTWNWFYPLTPFEAIFIGMVLLQISMLQLIGVIPINLNSLFYGMPGGKRRKRFALASTNQTEPAAGIQHDDVAETILSALRGLDKEECVLRALCEVEKQSLLGYKPPAGLKLAIHTFQLTSQMRRRNPITANPETGSKSKVMPYFEEALEVGRLSGEESRNSTQCERRYPKCVIAPEAILDYIDQMKFDEVF